MSLIVISMDKIIKIKQQIKQYLLPLHPCQVWVKPMHLKVKDRTLRKKKMILKFKISYRKSLKNY